MRPLRSKLIQKIKMSTPIIQISNLNFQYNKPILENLNWEISAGECWMLGGLSGSGKTTLAKIISGEIKNFEGKVEVNFNENSELPKKVLYVSNWFSSVIWKATAIFIINNYTINSLKMIHKLFLQNSIILGKRKILISGF